MWAAGVLTTTELPQIVPSAIELHNATYALKRR